jgi:hypothetical protein
MKYLLLLLPLVFMAAVAPCTEEDLFNSVDTILTAVSTGYTCDAEEKIYEDGECYRYYTSCVQTFDVIDVYQGTPIEKYTFGRTRANCGWGGVGSTYQGIESGTEFTLYYGTKGTKYCPNRIKYYLVDFETFEAFGSTGKPGFVLNEEPEKGIFAMN